MIETISSPDGTMLRTDEGKLRFLDPSSIASFLTEAGFAIDDQYGDWSRGPVTAESKEIITIACRA
jgi:hypothetical protein